MCEEIDNFDGQPLYYCSLINLSGFLSSSAGELVTNDYCVVKCKKKIQKFVFLDKPQINT